MRREAREHALLKVRGEREENERQKDDRYQEEAVAEECEQKGEDEQC